MNQRYSTAIQLAFLIVVLFTLIFGMVYYAYAGELSGLFAAKFYILLGQLALFLVAFVIIQLRIENFILTKVRELYKDLLPTGIPLNEDSLQKDVISITASLQQFAKESKLEIELLKDKENYRREFIGNLAHELKTPLFTVQSYIYTSLWKILRTKKSEKNTWKKPPMGLTV